MKLKENQLKLLRHLAQFETLDYLSCLRLLDTEQTNDRKALSYVFRPLTKHKYVSKRKDGYVNILAKGKALFPDLTPLVTTGGGADGAKRRNSISRTAMFFGESGIRSFAAPEEANRQVCFIPSTCWRRLRAGILSTTRFTGILFIEEHRLAVYDIGNGDMDWQLRAERSLFYQNYGEYETRATGMLLICDDDKRIEVAQSIIRMTMWKRKQLIGSESSFERGRPMTYVKAPIRLAWYYEHVYLSTPKLLLESLRAICKEREAIKNRQGENPKCFSAKEGDYEAWPYRYFVNITTDLLKYVYFFAAAKALMESREKYPCELNYALVLPRKDSEIVRMYSEITHMEGMKFYAYGDSQNAGGSGEKAASK